ncbi:hypothetical protein [Fervidibacter sp.]
MVERSELCVERPEPPNYALPITLHESRITLHALRITLYASRITLHE